MSNLADPFVRALATRASVRVDLVVVGVGGVNFFAKDPSEAVATRDLDLLVRPTPEVLGTALRALARAGFYFEAGGEPFVDIAHPGALAEVVRAGAAVKVHGFIASGGERRVVRGLFQLQRQRAVLGVVVLLREVARLDRGRERTPSKVLWDGRRSAARSGRASGCSPPGRCRDW